MLTILDLWLVIVKEWEGIVGSQLVELVIQAQKQLPGSKAITGHLFKFKLLKHLRISGEFEEKSSTGLQAQTEGEIGSQGGGDLFKRIRKSGQLSFCMDPACQTHLMKVDIYRFTYMVA